MKNEINIGGDSYSESRIISANTYMYQSIDGNELQYDVLNTRLEMGRLVKNQDGKYVYEMGEDPGKYRYGTPVTLKREGSLLGKFYVESVTRVGRTQYNISCISAIGLLERMQHYGGVYRGIKVPELLKDIIGDSIQYSLDSQFDDIKVYGWLPPASKRENLHQLLFAIGAFVSGDPVTGDPIFSSFRSESVFKIPDSRIYLGGSVKYPDYITRVSIHEHSFAVSPAAELVTLFDGQISFEKVLTPNGQTVEGGIVIFKEPCDVDSLASEGCEILEKGVNYAVLSPSMAAKLTGRKYLHTIRQVNRPEARTSDFGVKENKVTIANATLVSFANSENVADRIYNYYTSAKTVNADIIMGYERPGSAVEFNDAFGDKTTGFIQSMDIGISGVLKANTDIISGYKPLGPGNLYTHVAKITSNMNWEVPAGVKKIRVVLIGGGDGGASGCRGESNKSDSMKEFFNWDITHEVQLAPTEGGKGGLPGKGALGGKIYSVTLNVNPSQTFKVVIGNGGPGGVPSGNDSVLGGHGTASTFGGYSSESGTRSNAGYFEEINGETFASPGDDGVAGGDGVTGYGEYEYSGFWDCDRLVFKYKIPAPLVWNGVSYYPGQSQGTERAYGSESGQIYNPGGMVTYGYGRGLGGGPAAGANGPSTPTTKRPGATGATPVNGKDATNPGGGGHGGHGGGGAGGNGGGYAERRIKKDQSPQTAPPLKSIPSVQGGLGSRGGNGAPGVVLVYY